MIQKFFIWSHEHDGWWRPNHCGYTAKLSEAGQYSFEEALKICDQANFFNLEKGVASINESMVPLPIK